jgi:aromatic-L-amino-acid/L-tryptophan decarboxylase
VRSHPEVDPAKLVVYTTTQTHSLGKKAALVLGLQEKSLPVTLEDQFALRGSALDHTLKSDIQAGLHPFILSEIPAF